jgi:hypothetical protein
VCWPGRAAFRYCNIQHICNAVLHMPPSHKPLGSTGAALACLIAAAAAAAAQQGEQWLRACELRGLCGQGLARLWSCPCALPAGCACCSTQVDACSGRAPAAGGGMQCGRCCCVRRGVAVELVSVAAGLLAYVPTRKGLALQRCCSHCSGAVHIAAVLFTLQRCCSHCSGAVHMQHTIVFAPGGTQWPLWSGL